MVCQDCIIFGEHRGHTVKRLKEVGAVTDQTPRITIQSKTRCDPPTITPPIKQYNSNYQRQDSDNEQDQFVSLLTLSKDHPSRNDALVSKPSPEVPVQVEFNREVAQLVSVLSDPKVSHNNVAHALNKLHSIPHLDERQVCSLLTTHRGSLMTGIREILKKYLASPSPDTKAVLSKALAFLNKILDSHSLMIKVAIFQLGHHLARVIPLNTGSSFMYDLASLVTDTDTDFVGIVLESLALLASKSSCPALISCCSALVSLLSSDCPWIYIPTVTVLHEVAITEDCCDTIQQLRLGTELLLPGLALLLTRHCSSSSTVLAAVPLTLALGTVRALLTPLPPGSMQRHLVQQLADSIQWIRDQDGGDQTLMLDCLAVQKVLLPQYRDIQYFHSTDIRQRIRQLEKEFLTTFCNKTPLDGNNNLSKDNNLPSSGDEEDNWVCGKPTVNVTKGENPKTEKVPEPNGTLPSWLGGQDDSSSEEEEEEKLSNQKKESVEEIAFGLSSDEARLTSDCSLPVATSSPKLDNKENNGEGLIKGEILSVKQGPGVELWSVERYHQLKSNYGKLAAILCSFLNRSEGGVLIIGAERNRLVQGIPLNREQKDKIRQMLDRVLREMITPRVPPNLVDPDFIPVCNPHGNCQELQLVTIMVKGGWHRPGHTPRFKVCNVRFTGVEEGIYERRRDGEECRTVLAATL